MPRKNNVVYSPIAENVTISAVDYVGAPFSIQYLDRALLKLSFVGTLAGTPTLQVSNDYGRFNPQNDQTQVATWDDIPLGMVALTGASQDYVIDIQVTAMQWLRINVSYTSGSSVLNASATGKES